MLDLYMKFVRKVARHPRIVELVPRLNDHAAYETYARAAKKPVTQLTEREKRLALAHHIMDLVIEQDFIDGAGVGEPLGIIKQHDITQA